MGRTIAGPRAARSRPDTGVLIAAAAAGILLLAGCGTATREVAAVAASTAPSATSSPTPSPTPSATPSPTPPPTTVAATPTPSPTPVRIAVPAVRGMTAVRAAGRIAALGLRSRTVPRRTAAAPAGTVLAVSPAAGSRLARGTVVTLTVAQAPPPPPPPPPAPAPEPTEVADAGCHPSYSGCLKADAGDYDCAGGSGNGPYYTGRVTVLGPDVFDLDRDGDGIGCERD